MRLIFINRFYRPDTSATSQILTDIAEHLAERDHAVHIVCSRVLYQDPLADLARIESLGGVEVHRIWTSRFGRKTVAGRALDYLSFYVSCFVFLLGFVQEEDVLVAKTDPPLLSLVASMMAGIKGARLVNWLQDLYPEIAAAFGVSFAKGPVGHLAESLRNRSLRAAETNIVISTSMARRIANTGVDPEKVVVIPNWADDDEIRPMAGPDNPLRQAWGLSDQFVVGYSGNVGRVHEVATVLQAATLLKDHPGITFLFIGGGYHEVMLAAGVRQRGLEQSVIMKPYQDRALLSQSLCVPDVHWVSLRPGFDGLVLPSKIYGVMAAGRPILAVTGKDDELARLVEAEGCGVAVEVGDARAMADTILALARDPGRVGSMGVAAREVLDRRFSKVRAFAQWEVLVETLRRRSKHE